MSVVTVLLGANLDNQNDRVITAPANSTVFMVLQQSCLLVPKDKVAPFLPESDVLSRALSFEKQHGSGLDGSLITS